MENNKAANDFILTLSSAISGMLPEEYATKMSDLSSEGDISELENFVNKLVKTKITPEIYMEYILPIASQLNSLWCFMFNMKLPKEKQDRISDVLSKLNNHRLTWSRKQSRQGCDKEIRPLVKYAINGLGRKYYRYFPTKPLVELLIEKGLIYKNPRLTSDTTSFVVRGLHLAVGDNVFTVSYRGNHYRNYVQYCAPEAFYLRNEFIAELKQMNTESLPELPPYFKLMSIGDYKGCCKISLSYQEKNVIYNFMREHGL